MAKTKPAISPEDYILELESELDKLRSNKPLKLDSLGGAIVTFRARLPDKSRLEYDFRMTEEMLSDGNAKALAGIVATRAEEFISKYQEEHDAITSTTRSNPHVT